MTEEERAALYRQQCRNRIAARKVREAALVGNATARRQLAEAWAPLLRDQQC